MTTYSLADGIKVSDEYIMYIFYFFFFETGAAGASETPVRPTALSGHTASLAFLCSTAVRTPKPASF